MFNAWGFLNGMAQVMDHTFTSIVSWVSLDTSLRYFYIFFFPNVMISWQSMSSTIAWQARSPPVFWSCKIRMSEPTTALQGEVKKKKRHTFLTLIFLTCLKLLDWEKWKNQYSMESTLSCKLSVISDTFSSKCIQQCYKVPGEIIESESLELEGPLKVF